MLIKLIYFHMCFYATTRDRRLTKNIINVEFCGTTADCGIFLELLMIEFRKWILRLFESIFFSSSSSSLSRLLLQQVDYVRSKLAWIYTPRDGAWSACVSRVKYLLCFRSMLLSTGALYLQPPWVDLHWCIFSYWWKNIRRSISILMIKHMRITSVR